MGCFHRVDGPVTRLHARLATGLKLANISNTLQDYGEDGVDVFLCDVKGCGLYFHESCLGQYNVDVALVEDEDAGDEARTRPVFKCPAHKCWVCADDVPPPSGEGGAAAGLPATCVPVPAEDPPGKKTSKKGKGRKNAKKSAASGGFSFGSKKENLMRCLDCPISYHISCIPPSARFHELALLCHEHAYTSKLPYLDAEHSIQACVEAKAEKKIEDMRRREERRAARIARGEIDGSDDEGGGAGGNEVNKFLVGMHGADTTLEEDQLEQYLLMIEEERGEENDHGEDGDEGGARPRRRRKKTHLSYCLPVDFKEEVHSKPPAYAHVNSNRYDPDNRPRRSIFSGEKCRCKPSVEDGVPSCGERCDNRLNYFECCAANCDLGPDCGNRAMGRRRFAKTRVQREHGKGWGLISVNGVKSGDLVIEYAGEVIDEATKESRLAAWTRDHPSDPNFYVMALGQAGWYIDARDVANQARFINHSCDPNCRLVPLNVAGHMRVAIVTIRDVRPGEFLCYDYQFDTRQGDRFTCRCGSSNCRGTMKGGVGAGDDAAEAGKKTKKQLLAEAKQRVSRERKFLRSVAESEVTRLSLTGPVVPGSGGDETAEVVAAGPQAKKHREDAAAGRIFLWRNARVGGNFARRYRRWEERRTAVGSTTGAGLSAPGRLGTVDVISIVGKGND